MSAALKKFAVYKIFLMNNVVLFKIAVKSTVVLNINECCTEFVIALNVYRDSLFLRDLIRRCLETVATSRTMTGGNAKSLLRC